jgi:CRP-like cAMP-binding protein/rhodanese-related sulfurtransferase
MAVARQLTPFRQLRNDNLRAILAHATVLSVPTGRVLFNERDRDSMSFFLLEGSVSLHSDGRQTGLLRAGTEEAFDEIAPHKPRRVAAIARKSVKLLAMKSELLNTMLSWDSSGSYEVATVQGKNASFDEDEDWMTTLLQFTLLQHLPPDNIQGVFLRLERMVVRAGEVVAAQEEHGEFFYFLVKGQAVVRREARHRDGAGFLLARLQPGDTFGEQSLLSRSPRSASVVMESDGVVMRLSKQDFLQLLCAPTIEYLHAGEARHLVADGGAWLDVSSPEQGGRGPVDAVHIPLFMLRMKYRSLDRARPLVVLCPDGGQAAAAAFLLRARGYEAKVLRGGVATLAATRDAS